MKTLVLLICLLFAGPTMGSVAAQTYNYDGLGRLTQVIEPLQTTTYTYDASGNLLSTITVLAASGVESGPTAPLAFTMSKVAPNPIQSTGSLRFTVPERGHVRLHIFNVAGREIARPVDEVLEPGSRVVRLVPSRLAAGVYFFRLEWNGKALTRRFSIVH